MKKLLPLKAILSRDKLSELAENISEVYENISEVYIRKKTCIPK